MERGRLLILSSIVAAACLGCADEQKVTFPDTISAPPGTAEQQQAKPEAVP